MQVLCEASREIVGLTPTCTIGALAPPCRSTTRQLGPFPADHMDLNGLRMIAEERIEPIVPSLQCPPHGRPPFSPCTEAPRLAGSSQSRGCQPAGDRRGPTAVFTEFFDSVCASSADVGIASSRSPSLSGLALSTGASALKCDLRSNELRPDPPAGPAIRR